MQHKRFGALAVLALFAFTVPAIRAGNQIYATFFKSAPPARATVQVARLARDVKIEISAIAVAR